MHVTFTAAAGADLARIKGYIGQRNPAAASRAAVQLLAACDGLKYLPNRGRPGLVPGTWELSTVWP